MPTSHTKALPRWNLRAADPERVSDLARAIGVDPLLARLLVLRGFADAERARVHLAPHLKSLHDPFLLPGMEAATERLLRAIEGGEPILVHGDYDVDGVTGTALLVRLFTLLGAKVHWHIPNRLTDGYSFGPHSLERARECGAKIVISVDNGTSAAETIAALAAAGVETIVTDHHEPPRGALPVATALVNPKLADSTYPFRELCGGAVAFKLAWGLCQKVSGASRVRDDLREFLVDAMGYVAVATVCDVVPLVDENRVLARYGLKALEHTRTPGLAALLAVAGLGGRRLNAEDVGFQVGPRINASGRLGSAQNAVELLLARDEGEAKRLAKRLDDTNLERRSIERELLVLAVADAERFDDPERWPVIVVAGQGWHSGVVGIIAARLVDRYGRPALVIGLDGEEGRGSARSVPGFSILEAMHGGAAHMQRYGGHEQAAGCEVRADAIEDLREAVCARARELLGVSPPTGPSLDIDAEFPFPAMTPRLMQELDRLEPFGQDNEKPLFLARDVRLAEPPRAVGQGGEHLLLRIRRDAHVLKALAFGKAARQDELAMGAPLSIVYTPRWNTFRGETNLELVIEDFRAE